ncbi:LOW QUALITY PROTEIN: protein FREE1 [Asparagus officinalis]|uniref:LOW QUALITY PROTEIN: protein FREE1 n=1 Tax=Asparagus officinalis TaxID=4686 RepID=UPI00098DEE30|nr:LOW QUALITY PROTEIN: protein FREE1 [Asparagus officinalis]
MRQGSDYSSQYYPYHHPTPLPSPNPNPPSNPTEFAPSNLIQPPFASAPPYSQHPPSEFPSSTYSSYPQNPDPVPNLPPSAPSYAQPQFPQSQPSFNPQEPAPAPYPHLQQPHQPASGYAPLPNPNPNPPSYPPYENPYGNPARFDQGSGYLNDSSTARYGFVPETGGDGFGDGVYAYSGGKEEPYGARGTGGFSRLSSSSSGSGLRFDDYGRSLGSGPTSGAKEQAKIVRAVPKMDSQQDVKHGVQKFRVKLLPEGTSITTTDVLCQIGLDGIRMLDPSTNRTLRIYPLENVTRWEVLDSNIFAFWSKSPVDFEPRRIRLQSSSYTTSTILDTVTAATVQLKEMGGNDSLVRSSTDASKPPEQTADKKKGLADWMNFVKPGNEEKDHWVPDEAVSKCTSCAADFGAFVRKHHCRNCGDIFCDKCTQGRIALTADEQAQPVRVCDRCMAEVSQRLSNAKETANKSIAIHSHEDLAKKLQEEMERNRKSSSGSKTSDGPGRRMREVACPICTVHLQVQVPASGSETIECGVCQHPFLVSSH